MKGYLVEYTTPYQVEERKAFVPSEMYVPFLTCINDSKAEVTSSVLTENMPEDIPLMDKDTFGWLAAVGNDADGKRIFIPDTQLDNVICKMRMNNSGLVLITWTNRIVSGLDNAKVTGMEVIKL